jgi:hypothetical protein
MTNQDIGEQDESSQDKTDKGENRRVKACGNGLAHRKGGGNKKGADHHEEMNTCR